jgi:hypothetical protein
VQRLTFVLPAESLAQLADWSEVVVAKEST